MKKGTVMFASHLDQIRDACKGLGATSIILECYKISDRSLELERYTDVEFDVESTEHGHINLFSCRSGYCLELDDRAQAGNVWVVKKPLESKDMKIIPACVLKQQMVFQLSKIFSQITFDDFGNFLKFLRPVVARMSVRFDNGRTQKLDLYFEMESFIAGEMSAIERRWGQPNAVMLWGGHDLDLGPRWTLDRTDGEFIGHPLAKVFSRWTRDVTGGAVLVDKIRGYYVDYDCAPNDRGQFWCKTSGYHTEPPCVITAFGFEAELYDRKRKMKLFQERYAMDRAAAPLSSVMAEEKAKCKALDSMPCLKPSPRQRRKVTEIIFSLAKLETKNTSRAANRARSRSF